MWDVLDIQTQGCSELEDETDSVSTAKGAAKTRKGRGFAGTSDGELSRIKFFDKVGFGNDSTEVGVIPQGSVEGWVLFVAGIHEEATEDDVKDLFSEYGKVINLTLNLDRRTGYIKGYALVEYGRYLSAQNAKENLNGVLLLDQTIKVDWAFIKSPAMVKYPRGTLQKRAKCEAPRRRF